MDYLLCQHSDFSEVRAQLDPSQPLFCDTEGLGFYQKLRLIQFYQKHWLRPILVEWPNPLEIVALISQKVTTVWHNAHYDISTLQELNGKLPWMPDDFHCTLLLSRLHFYTKQKFSLDAVIEYVIGQNPYPNKKEMQGSDWAKPVLSDEQLHYAASDVVHLAQVWDTVKGQIDTTSYELDMISTRDALDFQRNGFPIDMERLEAMYAANEKRIKEIALPINCNSYKQVRAYINSIESDDLGLAKLSLQSNQRATDVRETRKLTKQNSFLTKFTNEMVDGHIFGKFNPNARSGRYTCKDQNLQQLPRSTKGIFGYEKDGPDVLIFSDFSQLELRCMCAIAADRTMERLMRTGEDMHGFTTKMCITDGEEYTKSQRQVGKTANFNLGYGGGAGMLSSIILTDAGILVSEEDCKKLKVKWLKTYPGINSWQQRGIRDYKAGRAWQTPLGRRYLADMMTDQLNIQIQGFGAEVAKIARHYFKKKLEEHKWLKTVVQLNFIHDSYILRCPNDPAIYLAAAKMLGDSMQEAWVEVCACSDLVKIKDLPMPVEVQVGFNWGDIEKGDFIYEYRCE